MSPTPWRSLMLLVLLVAPACAGDAAAFPPAPQVVTVAMREYEYAFDPPTTPGRIVFDARNAGTLDHELVLISVGDDIPPIDEQLRSGKRIVVPTVARLPTRSPDRSGTFAVDLPPGRFALVCFVKGADGGQHAQKGMSAEFRIRG